MELLKKKRGKTIAVYLVLCGLLAGLVNGLLGAGGGILIVFALSAILGEELGDKRDLYANALCVMLPISVVSCFRYAMSGNLPTEGFGVYVLPAVAGGVLGGILLGKLNGVWLKRLFGALVIWSGVLLMIR